MSAEPAAVTTTLAVEGLAVRYGKRTALENVSFSVPAGSVYALLGRNGAGKSSLVRCALGQQRPDSGSARVFGHEIWSTRAEAMQRVGVVPEEPDAPPGMTAPALSDFFRRLYPRWDEAGVSSRLARANVPPDVPFGRLSKGQKGAVMLALALGHSPELLILDDPTLGLDVVARRLLYDELIGELADRGATVLLTTHDLAGIEALADRVGILNGAHLLVDETLEGLKARFRRIRLTPVEGAHRWDPLTVVAETRHDWGWEAVVSNYDDERLAALRAAVGNTALEVEPLSLEQIFVALQPGPEVRS